MAMRVKVFDAKTMDMLSYDLMPVGTTTIERTWLDLDRVSCTVLCRDTNRRYNLGSYGLIEPIQGWVYGMVIEIDDEIVSATINGPISAAADQTATVSGWDIPVIMKHRYMPNYHQASKEQSDIMRDIVGESQSTADHLITVGAFGSTVAPRQRTFKASDCVTCWDAMQTLLKVRFGVKWSTSHEIVSNKIQTTIDYRYKPRDGGRFIPMTIGKDCELLSNPESSGPPIHGVRVYDQQGRAVILSSTKSPLGAYIQLRRRSNQKTNAEVTGEAIQLLNTRSEQTGRVSIRVHTPGHDWKPGDRVSLSGRHGPWVWDNSLMGVYKSTVKIEPSADPYCELVLAPYDSLGADDYVA